MSDPTVTAFLTKLLCSHGGRLPKERLTQLLELPPEQIELILQDEAQRFPQVGELVLAQSPIRICPRYLKNEGEEEEEEECGRLHLCRRYLQGNCRQSKRCPLKLSHDILSDHNQMVLKSKEISGLNDQELKVHLLQNDSQLLPEVCVKYLHGTCDQANGCTLMHVCGFFTRGECNRRVCKKSHNLLDASPDLLQNLPVNTVQSFQMLCELKYNQRFQEAGRDMRRRAPRGPRGTGRGRAKSRGGSRGKGQERQMEGTGSQVRGRSSSRPASESGESHRCGSGVDDDGDDGGHQKTELDKLMEDWFLPNTSGSGNTQVGSDRRPKLAVASSNPPKARPVQSDTTIPNAAQACVEQISSARSNKAMTAPIAPLTGSSQPIRPSHVPPTSSGGPNSNYSSAGDSSFKTVTSTRDGLYAPHPTALVGSTKPVITPISATSSASPIAQPLTQYSRIKRTTSSAVTPPFAATALEELYQSDAESKLTAASSNMLTVHHVRPNTTLPNAAQIRAEQISPATSNKAISASTDLLKTSSEQHGPSSVPPTSLVRLTSNQPTSLTGVNSISSKVSSNLSKGASGLPPVPACALSNATAPAETAKSPIGSFHNLRLLLEESPDLLQNLPLEAVQNFQMLCKLTYNQQLQEAGTAKRRGAPRGPRARGRGRGRAKSRGRNGFRGGSRGKGRERQTEGPGSQVQRRSSSRPVSESGESYRCRSGEDDDGGHQKTELDKLMEDCFLPDTSRSGNTQVGSDRRPKLSAASSNPPKVCPVQSDTTIPNAAQTRVEKISSARSNKTMIAPIAPLTGSNQPIRPSHVPPTSSGGLNSNYSSAGESSFKTVTSIRDGSNTPHPTALTGSTKPVITPISATSSASPIVQPLTQYNNTINSTTSSPVTSTFTTIPLEVLYQSDAKSKLTAAPSNMPMVLPVQPNTTLLKAAQTRAEHISPVTSNKAMSAPTDSLQRSSQPLGLSSVPPTSSVRLTSNQPTSLTGANSISSKVSSHLSKGAVGLPPVPAHALSTATAHAETAIYPVGGFRNLRASGVSRNPSRLSEGTDQHSSKLLASVKPMSRLDFTQYSGTRSADEVPQHQPVDKTTPDRPTSSSKSTPGKAPDICPSNTWKYCKLGGKCPDMHFYLPYRWQVFNGGDWEDVSNMENVEKAYCDPKVTRIPLVDFETMKSGPSPVRRLSTSSSVTKPSEYVMTTEWIWYWKDEYGNWTQYGQSNIKNVSSTLSSAELESIYLSDPTARIPFTAGQQQYEINFRVMKQRNIAYRTEKEVCRRPKFLSFEDVKMLKGSTKSNVTKTAVSPLRTGIYSKEWDTAALPEIGHQKVAVSENTSEFTDIVKMFNKTLSGQMVKRIRRIQNPSLWQIYQWQNEQMKKLNQGKAVAERQLFHGTDRAQRDNICNQNFDWRICCTHGTGYGQGSYFARDASYSHNYSVPTSGGRRTMFIARVLVGDYMTGDPNVKRPPLKPNRIQSYDSCVDNIYNPSIFVVFDKLQIYPEYVLEYEEEQKKSCVII